MTEYKDMKQDLTMLQMSNDDVTAAIVVAKRLGYSQHCYTSTSGLWGLFCLAHYKGQRTGCIVKTQEMGLLFVQTLEDLQLENQ